MRTVTVLFGDRALTNFMQSADVFEKTKAVVQQPTTAKVIDDFGDTNIKALIDHCEGEPYFLIAVYDGLTTYYRHPTIKTVSDGSRFTMLDDLLPPSEPPTTNR